MAAARTFNSRDRLLLLGCLSGCWAASFGALILATPRLLAPTIQRALVDSLAEQAQQLPLEAANRRRSATTAPGYSALRIWAATTPPPNSEPARGPEAEALRQALQQRQLSGALQQQLPRWQEPLGGYWLALPRQRSGSPVWVHASPGTALPWLWPLIRVGSLLLGGSAGFALFLQWQLQRPMRRLLEVLPAMPAGELELVPESGMAAMRELSARINRCLEQINHNQDSRRRFQLGLAHDIGSPLTRLSMRLERLEDTRELPAEVTQELPLLRADVDRLIALTHLLQEAAGSQAEPFRARRTAVDELCERVVASYPGRPIQLAVPRLQARLDYRLIERALVNLLDNALSYGQAPIRLSASQQRGELVLQVEDSGPGLGSANLLGMPRIAPADDRQQQRRSGIGLTVVERCCQLHGGRLHLGRSTLGGLQAELHLPQR